MKYLIIGVPLYILLIIGIWYLGKLVADDMSDYKVINPVPGVECIAISRMFNTSTDCWYTIKK